MATISAAHLQDIAAPLSSAYPGAPRSTRLPDLGDGAISSQSSTRPSSRPGRSTPPVQVSLPQEDRDAALTGSTRSLARRLFALNLHAHAAQPLPAMPHQQRSVQLRSA